jgi:hypothetical protein
MKLLDSICAPGSALGGGMKRGAGDDRYVFDEMAGWACVIDGATDVGPVRLFPRAESDAARYAEMFAASLLALQPGKAESPADYFASIVLRLRDQCAKEARVPLDAAPLASLPTAAATWLRARDGHLEGATLGDTLAIIRQPDGGISLIGDGGKPADEQARARKVMTMTPEQRHKWLQDLRAIHNTEKGYWVFGVQPEAAAHIVHQTVACPPGTRALLVTDGFYRLVSPYARYTDAQLMAEASTRGLGQLLVDLRGLESDAGDDAAIGRFKTSDDATALLVEF